MRPSLSSGETAIPEETTWVPIKKSNMAWRPITECGYGSEWGAGARPGQWAAVAGRPDVPRQ